MQQRALPTVYVVEDDERFRTALCRMLKAAGHSVHAYASGSEFLAASTEGPGCVVLDLQLPDLSGLHLQQELARRANALPVVFLTGHGSISGSVQAIRAGAEDFLEKPVERDDLLRAIERAVERDRARRGGTAYLEELQRRYATLNENERRVMSGVISGHLNKQMAFRFGRDLRTIKGYRSGVMKKMRAESTADLVRMAGLLGLPVEPPDS